MPHIPGEDEKLENEPRKLLGRMSGGELVLAELAISAEATRVPCARPSGGCLGPAGGTGRAGGSDRGAARVAPAIAAELPSSPAETLVYRDEADRPQPRLDRSNGAGLAWTVGNVRRCPVLDLRYMALTHNTLRGAASGAILNAELLVAQGIIPRP